MNIDLSTIKPTVAEREEAMKAHALWSAADQALEDARVKPDGEVSDEEFANLEDAAAVAREVCDELPVLRETWDGEVMCCALSGVPLLADDEVLESTHFDEAVLRCLVLPPRVEAPMEMESA